MKSFSIVCIISGSFALLVFLGAQVPPQTTYEEVLGLGIFVSLLLVALGVVGVVNAKKGRAVHPVASPPMPVMPVAPMPVMPVAAMPVMPVASNVVFCTQCGASHSRDKQFCEQCGNDSLQVTGALTAGGGILPRRG